MDIDFAYWDRETCFDTGYQAGIEGKCLDSNPFADPDDWSIEPLEFQNQYLWWERGMLDFIGNETKLFREQFREQRE